MGHPAAVLRPYENPSSAGVSVLVFGLFREDFVDLQLVADAFDRNLLRLY